MSEDKGVEEFVGEQEDYRCNSKLERDPVSSSDGAWIEALPELWTRVSLLEEAQIELTGLKKTV